MIPDATLVDVLDKRRDGGVVVVRMRGRRRCVERRPDGRRVTVLLLRGGRVRQRVVVRVGVRMVVVVVEMRVAVAKISLQQTDMRGKKL